MQEFFVTEHRPGKSALEEDVAVAAVAAVAAVVAVVAPVAALLLLAVPA